MSVELQERQASSVPNCGTPEDAGEAALAASDARRFSASPELQESVLEADRPPAGTPCRSCKLKGHFCQATEYFAEAPLCLPCLDGEPCSQVLAVRRMEEGEPISDPNVFPSEVRHLDPATVTITPAPEVHDKPLVRSDDRIARAQAAVLHRAVVARGGSDTRVGRGNVIDQEIADKARELRRAGVTLASIAGRLGVSVTTVDRYVRNVKKVSNVPTLPQPTPQKEESHMTRTIDQPAAAAAVPKKQCIFPGCTNKAAVKGSYCTAKHYYNLQKELGILGAPTKKKPAQKPAKAIAVTKPANAEVWKGDKEGMATITVPNEALDHFWHALSWDEKARIVGSCIAGVLMQGGGSLG